MKVSKEKSSKEKGSVIVDTRNNPSYLARPGFGRDEGCGARRPTERDRTTVRADGEGERSGRAPLAFWLSGRVRREKRREGEIQRWRQKELNNSFRTTRLSPKRERLRRDFWEGTHR